MIQFEVIHDGIIEAVMAIVNSNPAYNQLENGSPIRSKEEVEEEFLNPDTDSYLVRIDNKCVGIIDFLRMNPNDGYPWVGLFMIHGDFQSLGYGKKIYQAFEQNLKQKGISYVRLGVLQENTSAAAFWSSLGFECYQNLPWRDTFVICFEKSF